MRGALFITTTQMFFDVQAKSWS